MFLRDKLIYFMNMDNPEKVLDSIIKYGVITGNIYDCVHTKYRKANKDKSLSSIDDLVFVHATDFFPNDNMLFTSRGGNRVLSSQYRYGDGMYDYSYKVPLDNLFFTINCLVHSHECSNFDKKIAVLIDGKRMDLSKSVYANPVDYAVNSNINLEKQNDKDYSAFILCPYESMKELRERNDNSIIIGYSGITLNCAVETIMLLLGKKIEIYGPIKYQYSNDDLKYIAPILKKHSLKPRINTGASDDNEFYGMSEYGFMDEIRINIQEMIGIMKAATERGQNISFDEVEKSIIIKRPSFNFTESNVSFELYKNTVIDELSKEGYDIGSQLDNLEEYHDSILEGGDELDEGLRNYFSEILKSKVGNGGYVLTYLPMSGRNDEFLPIRFTPEYIVRGNKLLYDIFSQQYSGEANYSNSQLSSSGSTLEEHSVQKRYR